MTFYSINLDRDEALALRNAVAWTLATCCGTHRVAPDVCDTCETLQGIGRDLDRLIAKPGASQDRAGAPPRGPREQPSRPGSSPRSRPAGRDHLMLLPSVAHD